MTYVAFDGIAFCTAAAPGPACLRLCYVNLPPHSILFSACVCGGRRRGAAAHHLCGPARVRWPPPPPLRSARSRTAPSAFSAGEIRWPQCGATLGVATIDRDCYEWWSRLHSHVCASATPTWRSGRLRRRTTARRCPRAGTWAGTTTARSTTLTTIRSRRRGATRGRQGRTSRCRCASRPCSCSRLWLVQQQRASASAFSLRRTQTKSYLPLPAAGASAKTATRVVAKQYSELPNLFAGKFHRRNMSN